jgi:hypothetical protein
MANSWKKNTAAERTCAADLLAECCPEPEQLAWALEWVEGTAEADSEYHILLHYDGDHRCLGVAPVRWVAGADQVLEVLDLFAAPPREAATRNVLWKAILDFCDAQKVRLLSVALQRPQQEPLFEFLCEQGLQLAGEIQDYYRPGHHLTLLIRRLSTRIYDDQ